jgi:hypothetical protein
MKKMIKKIDKGVKINYIKHVPLSGSRSRGRGGEKKSKKSPSSRLTNAAFCGTLGVWEAISIQGNTLFDKK